MLNCFNLQGQFSHKQNMFTLYTKTLQIICNIYLLYIVTQKKVFIFVIQVQTVHYHC